MLEQLLGFFTDGPYLLWACGAASVFYGVTVFAISHLHEDKKAQLSLWLQGDYESTWPKQFGEMFDSIFGEKHWHLRCILLSAAASVVAVFGLWLLLDQILGLISLRADTGLSLAQALVLGALINIIPDYISLYETRWLLKQFERVRNPFAQLLVLIGDAVLTGVIIYLGIQGYLWATGQPAISLVEMVALFSFYAIFFYSTFLTSIWAWAYCLSSWMARFGSWLDAKNSPGPTLALIGAGVILIGALGFRPVVAMDEDGRIALDDFLCAAFPASACTHVARLTADERQKLDYLSRACIGGATEECLGTGFSLYQINPEQAVILWTKSCNSGNALGCYNLGVMYRQALGVEQDYARAVDLYKQGCDGGEALSCTNFGVMYAQSLGVEQDYARAVDLYKQGCDGGNALGCTNLGFMYHQALGVEQEYARAVDLYKRGCEGGEALGCTNLGFMYRHALGVEQDYARAVDLYKRGCEGGEALGCTLLGWSHQNGLGVQADEVAARSYYAQGCEMGDQWACNHIETLPN